MRRAHARDVSALVHDLNNPLTIIQGNLHFLRDALSISGDAREALVDIENATARLARMLEDARLLARMERGDALPAGSPCSAALIARTAVGEEVREAENRSIVVGVEVLDLDLIGDEQALRRAVAALVLTAIQHTPSRGTVKLTVAATADDVCFIVESGVGAIAPEELAELVAPSVSGTSGRVGRSAFRWRLARAVFEAHGGSVVAEAATPLALRLVGRLPAP